ncbi:MAG: hypothetical protein R2874_15880 [Desulfobacterales bacterium]
MKVMNFFGRSDKTGKNRQNRLAGGLPQKAALECRVDKADDMPCLLCCRFLQTIFRKTGLTMPKLSKEEI